MTTPRNPTPQYPEVQRHLNFLAKRKAAEARQRWFARLFLWIGALVFLTPLYWMLVTSVKSDIELTYFPPTFIPKEWHFENYQKALSTFPFWHYFRNTVFIAVMSMIGAVVSNTIVAYGFSRLKWPGRDLLFGLVIATIFVPTPSTMIPLFVLYAKLHWVNTYLPLIVPAFFGNAFSIFLLRQFLLQVPFELSESARIDGANEFQIMTRIILPLAKPAITVVAIFAFIGAWNDFMGPLIYLSDESKYTLAIGMQFFRTQNDLSLNLLMAASAVAVAPVLALFAFFQRSFIDGITLGSIK